MTHWVNQAIRVGVLTSVQIPVAVLLTYLVPALSSGYPLTLLPLLLTGPLAVRSLPPRTGAPAAVLAGVISGIIAAFSLAFGSQVLGIFLWSLNNAASRPPMPSLPQPALLPSTVMTWAQQDVLFLQPVLALVLSLLTILAGQVGVRLLPRLGRALPRSLSNRLALAFGGVTALTFVVGWVSFGALEEMHFRGHRIQLQADWQSHLSDANALIDAQVAARRAGAGWQAQADQIDSIYAHLAAAAPHPAISLSTADRTGALAQYGAALGDARAAQATFRAAAADDASAAAAANSLAALRKLVDGDVVTLLASDDVAHHQRLIAVMLAVGLAGALSLWLAHQAVMVISGGIAPLGAHLVRVAGGDFTQRVPENGLEELARLATSVNHMTGELDRLYEAERVGRAQAEALAGRERELTEAKEFWANTVVHDMKSPLSIIAGYLDLLETGHLGSLAEGQQQALREMKRATADLLGLAEDINDTFRLEADALSLHREPVAAADLLQEAVRDQARPDAPAAMLRQAPALPPVSADGRLVHRVLRNLVSNAYTHAGRDARVVLSANVVEPGWVQFGVEDSGPGIPIHLRQKVFERFVQGDRNSSGSGLGLAFCKLVVERHGGRIWVDEPEGGGTLISFALPIWTHQSSDAAASELVLTDRAG